MGSEWGEITLADSLEFVVDNRGKTVPASETGIPLIATNCVSNENLYPEHINVRYVNQDTFDTWFRAHPEPGDILLTNKGSKNGAVCLCPDPVGFCIAQDMVALRAKREVIDPHYLFAALRSSVVQYQIKQLNVDSVIPHFKKTDFDKLHIPLPSKEEQERIGEIHFQLCNKIELNRRMNETLEGMAQALFKSWFVDFDPVIDNALAAGNPIPELLAQRAETRRQALASGTANRESAQTFPASFRFTEELGWIPEGWEVKELRNYSSTISKGTTPRKKDVENADDQATVPFIKVRDITDEGELIEVGLDKIPRSIHVGALKRSMLQSGDVLFSIAGTIGRVTILPESLNDSNSNQAIAFIRPENTSESNFLLEHLKGEFVQNRIHSRIVQAVQANVSLTELGDIPTITPIREIMKKWSDYSDPIYRQVIKSRNESQTLAKLRDVLLPKLISGELRIPQAEKMVKDAIA